MAKPTRLRVYLEPEMLASARAGGFNFLNRLKLAIESAGWAVEWRETGPAERLAAPTRGGYALFHMEPPTHARALTFRRAYHYPFWNIEPVAERWNFHVARQHFDPARIDPAMAADFATRLRRRVLPDARPQTGDHILVPLQGRIRQHRSFQSHSPVEMLRMSAETGRPVIATLHPRESYDAGDHAALTELAARHPNLTIGGDTPRLLESCAFVVTENSAVAFDGYLLGKPAVLFAQVDFHHIALNVADLGAEAALSRAPAHRPDFAAYLYWLLHMMAVDAMAPDAEAQILQAMRRGGWPL